MCIRDSRWSGDVNSPQQIKEASDQLVIFLMNISGKPLKAVEYFFAAAQEASQIEGQIETELSTVHRYPCGPGKKAIKDFIKKNGKSLESGNSLKGISLAQTQDLFKRGKTSKMDSGHHVVKVDRTGPRMILSKDKKKITWLGADHDRYEKYRNSLKK